MTKAESRVKTSKRSFIMALALLLATNITMGVVLMVLSKASLREQMSHRVLDIARTAAYQLDGDEMKLLTAEDKGTENYEKAMKVLQSFQNNIQLDYIYSVREKEDGSFSYTVDPDPLNPAEFGEKIEATPALKKAAKGMADVEQTAHTDAWGRFYSAYCPIFDSQGNVAGIVGVDFNADWYDSKLNSNRTVTIVLTALSFLVGVVLSISIYSHNKRRLNVVLDELSELDRETKKLDHLIMRSSIKKLDLLPDSESQVLRTLARGEVGKRTAPDEYDEVNTAIQASYKKLREYVKYVDEEIYTDNMTGVLNKAAYKRKIKSIDENIEMGKISFAVAFFDVNELKKIYTHFGFEAGDMLMFECAKILKDVYDKENVYHVTGDEYIVILTDKSDEDMKSYFDSIDEALKKYNQEHEKDSSRLSVAKGYMIFDPEKHGKYRHVFIEAQKNCEADKAEYYAQKKQETDRTII